MKECEVGSFDDGLTDEERQDWIDQDAVGDAAFAAGERFAALIRPLIDHESRDLEDYAKEAFWDGFHDKL